MDVPRPPSPGTMGAQAGHEPASLCSRVPGARGRGRGRGVGARRGLLPGRRPRRPAPPKGDGPRGRALSGGARPAGRSALGPQAGAAGFRGPDPARRSPARGGGTKAGGRPAAAGTRGHSRPRRFRRPPQPHPSPAHLVLDLGREPVGRALVEVGHAVGARGCARLGSRTVFALLAREWPRRRRSELAPLGGSVRLGPAEPGVRSRVPHAPPSPPPPPAAWRDGPARATNGRPPAPASRAPSPRARPPPALPPRGPRQRPSSGRAGREAGPERERPGLRSLEFQSTSRPRPGHVRAAAAPLQGGVGRPPGPALPTRRGVPAPGPARPAAAAGNPRSSRAAPLPRRGPPPTPAPPAPRGSPRSRCNLDLPSPRDRRGLGQSPGPFKSFSGRAPASPSGIQLRG